MRFLIIVKATPESEARALPEESLIASMATFHEELARAGALLDLGVGLLTLPNALPHLEQGTLLRLLPDWHADAGPISLYFAGQKLLPAKTRAFVDFVSDAFQQQGLAERLRAG